MSTQTGNIPFIAIEAKTIPEAYEEALKRLWNEGMSIKTEYDKADDPPSKDATVAISIADPFGQPRFHRSFADSLGALAEYVMEVIYGAHDYWVKSKAELEKGSESTDTRWTYTYHGRLFNYEAIGEDIDQVDIMAARLAAGPHTRRAQAITWNPRFDALTEDAPCLQRIWGRIVEDEQGEKYFNLNTHWRSRDLFKAWFENVIALTTLQKKIAERLSEAMDEEVKVGRYFDVADSLHIYGSYFREIQGDPEKGVRNFFEMLDNRPFAQRTWNSEFVQPFFIDDGTGKGVEPMLKREKGQMPEGTWKAIESELQKMKQEGYVV